MSRLSGFNQHLEEGYKMTPEQFDLTENKPAKHIIAMERVRHAGLVLGEAEAKSEIALAFRNQALEVYNIALKAYKVSISLPTVISKPPKENKVKKANPAKQMPLFRDTIR